MTINSAERDRVMERGSVMNPLYLVVAIFAVFGVALILWLVMRSPAVHTGANDLRQDVRELSNDAQDGVRDAADATKKAAEDAKNGIKDAVK